MVRGSGVGPLIALFLTLGVMLWRLRHSLPVVIISYKTHVQISQDASSISLSPPRQEMSIQQEEHLVGSSPRTPHRPPSAPPPPYTYPSNLPDSPTEPYQPPSSPLHFTTVLHEFSKSPRRPLPPVPEPRIDTNFISADQPVASGSRSAICVSTSSLSSSLNEPPSSFKPSSSSPSLSPPSSLDMSTSLLMRSAPTSSRSPKHHSFGPLLSLLRPSKSRSSTTAKQVAVREAQSTAHDSRTPAEEVRRVAELEGLRRVAAEHYARQSATRENAKEAIRSNIRSLLSRQLTPDEYGLIFEDCAQICESGDLDLSTVLQEPLIDEKPPVYWAILNGPSAQGSDEAFRALVVALLRACEPLNDATITSIRFACMLTSNDVLLQHLFRHFAALSPLTPGDAILLSSVGGGDVVEVNETQDGTGTFIARIQVRRFRLRMRVSKLVKIEFVTSGRLYHLALFGLSSI